MKLIDFLHNINEEDTFNLLNIIKCPKMICNDWEYNGQCNFKYGKIGVGLACKNCYRKFLKSEFINIKIPKEIYKVKKIDYLGNCHTELYKTFKKENQENIKTIITIDFDSLENLHKNIK